MSEFDTVKADATVAEAKANSIFQRAAQLVAAHPKTTIAVVAVIVAIAIFLL